MAKRNYLNESHRKYCEACQKDADEMLKRPLSYEEMKAQCDMVREVCRRSQTAEKK